MPAVSVPFREPCLDNLSFHLRDSRAVRTDPCGHTRKHRCDPLALRNEWKREGEKHNNKPRIHTANKRKNSCFHSAMCRPGPLPISSILNLQQISLNCAERTNPDPFEDPGQQHNNNTLYKRNISEIRLPFDAQRGTPAACAHAPRHPRVPLTHRAAAGGSPAKGRAQHTTPTLAETRSPSGKRTP